MANPHTTASITTTFSSVCHRWETPLQKTEQAIEAMLRSENKEAETIALDFLHSGGKRLRPFLLLTSAACGEGGNEDDVITAAAAVEVIHMASLIHDDIVDQTPLRRGKPTVSMEKGTMTALCVGNIMLTKALSALSSIKNETVQASAVVTAEEMCRGEFSQLNAIRSGDITTEDYLDNIRRKTAKLMTSACEIGAKLGNADEKTVTALRVFGENLGMAFQITDDILDYTAETKEFGKIRGNDLMEGLPTLPLLCAEKNGEYKKEIRRLRKESLHSAKAVEELIRIVEEEEGTKKAKIIAENYLEKAIAALEPIKEKAPVTDLLRLTDFIRERKK